MTEKSKGPEFEKALERLETIVTEMEGGALSLETMIKRFEEGRKLVALCSRKLNEVERRIEILVKKGDDVEAEPFAEDETAADTGPVDARQDGGEPELF